MIKRELKKMSNVANTCFLNAHINMCEHSNSFESKQ